MIYDWLRLAVRLSQIIIEISAEALAFDLSRQLFNAKDAEVRQSEGLRPLR
jgi:hypothetical protein